MPCGSGKNRPGNAGAVLGSLRSDYAAQLGSKAAWTASTMA